MIPPPAFALVEPGIYRSSIFSAEHFDFLGRLHLKTLLYVSPDFLLKSLVRFAQERGIRLVNLIGHETWSEPDVTLKSESVKRALEILLNSDHHPVLVMCTTGLHHTGAICAALRQVQGWAFTSILEEFRRFASADLRVHATVEHAIERFDVDLVTLPKQIPWWLASHLEHLDEETDKARAGTASFSASCGPLRTEPL